MVFKLKSQGAPFKMVGASPLKLNPLTAVKAIYKGGKALYKSKKARKVVGGTLAAGGTHQAATDKTKNRSTFEKIWRAADEWGPTFGLIGAIVDTPAETKEQRLSRQERDAKNVFNVGKPKY